AYVFGRIDWARYLLVYYLPGAQELTIFCGALAGAALGFLWFNAHPAQVFMGDTGALAIGGALGTVAIMLKAEFLLLIAGGVVATKLLARAGVRVYASDASDHPYGGNALADLGTLAGVALDVGRHDLTRIRTAAAVIVSPGVPPESAPLVAARAAGVPVLSE